ncbi:MAG: DUF4824 family protein [Burkholderiales bacterium]|nr:DUF4824 family protein [Burkholderiales bacterium]
MKRITIAGIALILFTNAFVLLGVAWNRSGTPESELSLTQRELHRSSSPENSGLSLSLNWRVAGAYPGFSGGSPQWLDRTRMKSLGFGENRRNNASREILVVLELDGEAYRNSLARAEALAKEEEAKLASNPENKIQQSVAKNARLMAENEKLRNSRLFAVDAGANLDSLRGKYPDRRSYAIVHARARQWMNGKGGGYLDNANASIHVPLEFRPIFKSQDFVAEIAFGRRLEPWLVSAKN